MGMKKKHLFLLALNIATLLSFGIIFLTRSDYEFIIYIAVIITLLVLIVATLSKVSYTDSVLVGLTV